MSGMPVLRAISVAYMSSALALCTMRAEMPSYAPGTEVLPVASISRSRVEAFINSSPCMCFGATVLTDLRHGNRRIIPTVTVATPLISPTTTDDSPTARLHRHTEDQHGGNLSWAMTAFGGRADQWLDLSTGINPHGCPVPEMPATVWQRLPDSAAFTQADAARKTFGVPSAKAVVVAAGTQAAINVLPRMRPQ